MTDLDSEFRLPAPFGEGEPPLTAEQRRLLDIDRNPRKYGVVTIADLRNRGDIEAQTDAGPDDLRQAMFQQTANPDVLETGAPFVEAEYPYTEVKRVIDAVADTVSMGIAGVRMVGSFIVELAKDRLLEGPDRPLGPDI